MLSRRMRVISSVGSLLFGGAILTISLVAASQPFAYVAPAASHTSLYLNTRILPDHALYPVAMVLDRIMLLTSAREQRVLREVAFAFDRLDSATDLLQKDKSQLALVTLKKSQHYLLVANSAAQADKQTSPLTKTYLRRALRAHIKRMAQLRSRFPLEEQQAIADMLVQSTSLYTNLPTEAL
ncbi:MAG: hypothetical protein A3A82_03780 [Candidatus Pacebacteria bacterium RIFCSPLOWO2_01_FULL_47_12]|nr:MAG: hypothetical protein A3A82_03780 [Candidatus Pacebacteria bacterium RIFCSPLOWO2_01_FULL_47_12]